MEIKNCPFCGGEANYFKYPGNWGYTNNKLVVKCDKCHVEMAEKSEFGCGLDDTKKLEEEAKHKLINRWNTRNGD